MPGSLFLHRDVFVGDVFFRSKSALLLVEAGAVGVSWKTDWLLHHKLVESMLQREATQPLPGAMCALTMPIWEANAASNAGKPVTVCVRRILGSSHAVDLPRTS